MGNLCALALAKYEHRVFWDLSTVDQGVIKELKTTIRKMGGCGCRHQTSELITSYKSRNMVTFRTRERLSDNSPWELKDVLSRYCVESPMVVHNIRLT